MKIQLTALVFAFTGASFAQLPFETEADRQPTLGFKGNVLFTHANILTVTKGNIKDGDILIQNGKIAAIGRGLKAPVGVATVDLKGKFLMPGIVDTHSHRGLDGVNEGSDSVGPEAAVRYFVNPEAKTVWQALASGHTSALLLHGSANAVGGESVVVKYKYRRPVNDMIVPDAPRMVKFALGENVTRKGDDNGTRYPRSRMGVETVYRRAFAAARDYKARIAKGEKVKRDLRLEALADILDRKIWVQCHSYRSDEMLMMVRLSQEYGFKIGAMQHALEAYKIAPEMAKAGIGAGMFADLWGYKIEAYDAMPWNAWICWKAGVLVSINTDGTNGTTALNLDAAKTMRYGAVPENEALKMITINPATELGIDKRTGSLEVGKDGDLSIWDGHPFSVYSRPAMTVVEGEAFFVRKDAFGVDPLSVIKSEPGRFRYLEKLSTPRVGRKFALVNGTVYPVSGPAIRGGTVVVEDGKITAVGRDVSIPSDAKRIEVGGKSIYPGFIDAGANIGLNEVSPIAQMNDSSEFGENQPDLNARTAIWPESVYFGTARMNGITHSLCRPVGGVISGQAAFIQHDGKTVEEIGIGNRAALSINFPTVITYKDLATDFACCSVDSWTAIGSSWLEGRVPTHLHDKDMAGFVVAESELPARIKELDTYISNARDYLAGPRFPRDERYEAMEPYVRRQKPVLLRVRNAATIRAAVDFAKRNRLNVILGGANDAWKEADLLARERIPVIIEPAGRVALGANSPTADWDPYDAPYAAAGILARAGVVFAFESADNSASMNLANRAGQSCAYGLKPEDAIKALTLNAAKIFGQDKLRGSIEAGKMADLIVVDGDPLEMASQVQMAFIAGQPVELTSKFTVLRDKYSVRR